jgi:predicted secreted Zn-dependent protease
MGAKKLNLNEQAQEIMSIAEKHGVEQNYFFLTTFKRYQVQLKILQDLEKELSKAGVLVTKEYVKGRGNLYTHPGVGEYNKTSTAANQTVTTLVKIITTLRKDNESAGDELLAFLKR